MLPDCLLSNAKLSDQGIVPVDRQRFLQLTTVMMFERRYGLFGLDSSNAGFVGSQGVDYVFSADSFRRMEGESPNVFTYKAAAGTDLNNYNFFFQYGTLEID